MKTCRLYHNLAMFPSATTTYNSNSIHHSRHRLYRSHKHPSFMAVMSRPVKPMHHNFLKLPNDSRRRYFSQPNNNSSSNSRSIKINLNYKMLALSNRIQDVMWPGDYNIVILPTNQGATHKMSQLRRVSSQWITSACLAFWVAVTLARLYSVSCVRIINIML